jgi:hypothetical protein
MSYDDKNAALNYSGTWGDMADSMAYNGSFKRSTVVGSSVTMNFTGQSFSILYTANSTFGKLDVFVDGALVGTIDQYAASREMQKKWNLPIALTVGTHSLKLVHKGLDRASVDAVTVSSSSVSATATSIVASPQPTATAIIQPTATQPSQATTYDDKNAVFIYSGTWNDVADAGAYSGSFKKSIAPGQSVSMTFSGRSFSVLYTKNSAFTKMDVFVDGVLVGTIDQYSATRQLQQKWDLPIALASGTHTLKLVHKGTDTATRVALDAVTIYP